MANIAALGAALALAVSTAPYAQPKATEKPQYGGALSVANVYYTISPLTFDSADMAWKFNQDTGLAYEQLFVADLSKAKRNGGKYPFISDSFIPPESLRGELAEKWELKPNPWRLEVQLRKGIMWPAKPGVMAARELVADDVAYSFDRVNKSPKKIPTYWDHVARIEITGKHSLVMHFGIYNAEWDYRWGWGYYSAIVPKEVMESAGVKDWKNVNGTGPYALTNYVQGNAMTFTKNPAYWDSETIGGEKYKLPFTDTITYRYIKDESTALTALRTGKIDIMESVRWSAVDELKKNAPKLQWNKFISNNGSYITLRLDQKPFDDPRVRRALNLAINKPEIIKAYYYVNTQVSERNDARASDLRLVE